MIELFQMWVLVEVIGILCLPLTMVVCHNLPDRGWAFSKTLGLLLLAFCIWFPLMSVHSLPFSQFFIIGVALILLAGSLLSFVGMRQTLKKAFYANRGYIVAAELVFLGMVFLLGLLRSYGPEIRSYEMFMDEGFIASIMRSQHLPPNDMWFAGGSINYYYYAHFTIAMLAKMLGQSPSIAFNTGISIFFGLTAVNLFGVTCNIVGWGRYLRRQKSVDLEPERADAVFPSLLAAIPYGLLTMLMGLVFGNLAATQQWWQQHGDALAHYDWFGPSRVIPFTINEFPAFSFLLSCFHAHVLALAFTILGIGLACNLLLERDGKGLATFGRGWRLPVTLGVTALVLGSLFTMNGWDYPTYTGLAVVCIGLQQWLAYNQRFQWSFLLDLIVPVVSLVVLSLLLYLPFYLSFSSPAQGVDFLRVAQRTQLSQELMIYGLFAFVFLSLLVASVLKGPLFEEVPEIVYTEALPVAVPVVAGYAESGEEDEGSATLQLLSETVQESVALEQSQEGLLPAQVQVVAADEALLPMKASQFALWLRLALLAIYLLACLMLLRFVPNSGTFVIGSSIAIISVAVLFYIIRDRSLAFILLLGAIAFALVAVCEIVYLKDAFAGGDYQRMNTVFKFYFQSWALLSIACGAGVFFMLDSFRLEFSMERRAARYWIQSAGLSFWCLCLLLLVVASMAYPLVAPYARFARNDPQTQRFGLFRSNSLDGLSYLQNDPASAGDYAAIRWLNAHIAGDPVLVEAVGDDYSSYARISALTGLPTPMGWVGHEIQWRLNWLNKPGNAAEFGRRGGDVSLIYTNANAALVEATLAHYHAQYLYVGELERAKYSGADLQRFSTFMQVVYNANGVTIYKVR